MQCEKMNEPKFESIDSITPDCFECFNEMRPCSRINDLVVQEIREIGETGGEWPEAPAYVPVKQAEEILAKEPEVVAAPTGESKSDKFEGCKVEFLDAQGNLKTQEWDAFAESMCTRCMIECPLSQFAY